MLYTEFKTYDNDRFAAVHKEDGTELPAILNDGSLVFEAEDPFAIECDCEVCDPREEEKPEIKWSYEKARDLLKDIESRAWRLQHELWKQQHAEGPNFYGDKDDMEDASEELADWAQDLADLITVMP